MSESAAEHPGEPDGLERLWTPHRMIYIGGQDKPADATPAACPFCTIPSRSDEDGLVVARGEHAYVVLNLYPYNAGHLLVCPYRHVADYTDLTTDEVAEVAELTRTAMRVVRAVSAPHGFNLGMNQGAVAGAGIAAHLHQHVVPRWAGDANFLPVVGQTKALPQLLAQTRELFADEWRRQATAGAGPHTTGTRTTAPGATEDGATETGTTETRTTTGAATGAPKEEDEC